MGRRARRHISYFSRNSQEFEDTNHPWTAPSWTPWWALGLGARTIYARAMSEITNPPWTGHPLGHPGGLGAWTERAGREHDGRGGRNMTDGTGQACKYNKNQSTLQRSAKPSAKGGNSYKTGRLERHIDPFISLVLVSIPKIQLKPMEFIQKLFPK